MKRIVPHFIAPDLPVAYGPFESFEAAQQWMEDIEEERGCPMDHRTPSQIIPLLTEVLL